MQNDIVDTIIFTLDTSSIYSIEIWTNFLIIFKSI